jgi:threonine/homoserine/homoserine lactone efflux protein
VISLLAAGVLGLGLGIITGMPLAVVNVAIVEATSAGRRRFAQGLALGGGTADTVHAMLAFAGVGRVVTANPALVRWLAIGAALVIVGYTVVAWRRRHVTGSGAASGAGSGPASPPGSDRLGRGIAAGVMLTLPNPAALGAWVAVAASLWSDATLAEAGVLAAGVGLGSAAWFTLLARWLSRVYARDPDRPVLRWLPRVALVLFVATAAVGVIRAL